MPSVSDFLRQFDKPDPRFSPAPIWWWSGERLEIGRLRWQMDQLSRMGIHNVVILNLAPSGPLFGSDADDPPFLSEQWWAIFRQVCDHAKSIGMFVWFYDQIGFSGANYQAELVAVHPQFMAERLRVATAEGKGTLRVTCPGDAKPQAAYVVDASRPEDVRYIAIDGRDVSVDVGSESKLCLVYTLRQGYDYFNRTACEKLLDTVHREFEKRVPEHLGTTIPGSFQDELPDLPTWSAAFAETFERSFGYRLQDVIHRLFEPGDDESRRTRVHYHQHRATLAEEALFKPFYQWHEERGLQCGFDQQSPAREARVLGSVAKYADYTRTHRWYAAPGCDLHGNGKLHSSMAFVNDRPRVWIEGFHSTGWGGTIADTFDWLLPYLQSGSNLYNPHAVYYSTRMGWWEWAPPSTCWRQPYARHYRGFAEMVARLTKLLSRGVQQADVAVLFPTTTVQADMTPTVKSFARADAADATLHRLIGSMRWHEAKLGVLDEHAIDFHVLDEMAIRSATMRDGAMRIRGAAMRTLILPSVSMLERGTADALRRFAAAGGRVVAVGSGSAHTDDREAVEFASLPGAVVVDDVESVGQLLGDTSRAVRSPVPVLHRRLEDGTHVLLVPANTGMTTTVVWRDWFASLESATHDPGRCLKNAELRLPASARQVCRFDPIDARVRPLKTLPTSDGRLLRLDFEGAAFAVVAWSEADDESAVAPARGRSENVVQALADEWTIEYEPTLPTEHADIYDPRRPELRSPHTAEFAWQREGASAAETVCATFGVRAWATTGSGGASTPIVYSPQFGILRDDRHLYTLGPKGHVPEEFMDLGKLEAGQSVTIRTGVRSDSAREAVLAVGSAARKSARVGSERFDQTEDGAHLWMTPVRLQSGDNDVELTFAADHSGRHRAFWCLLRPESAAAFGRPERLVPPDEPAAGSRLAFTGRFRNDAPVTGGRLQVAVAAVASVFLDGQLLGRLGGFDPYRIHLRGQLFDLPALTPGEHELRIEMTDPGDAAPLVVDLVATDSAGRAVTCVSDSAWMVSRDDGASVPVRLHARQEGDGAAWHLFRRPHPLPRSAWIEGPQPPVVLDLPLTAPSAESIAQQFEWTIPPGTTAFHVNLVDAAEIELRIDGQPVAIEPGGHVTLPGATAPPRAAVLRVRSRQLGGGVFAGPVTYTLGRGRLKTGSWLAQGLRSYSGAIRMRQSIEMRASTRNLILDVGQVRGTVEARLNGLTRGVRFLAPYRFELGDAVRAGANELELVVTNTLANFLSTWSPTRGWSPDQFECGVFGPVTIGEPQD